MKRFGKRSKKETTGRSLPCREQKLMISLSKALGIKSFILYGGAAIDRLIGLGSERRDFDVAIKKEKGIISKCKENLRKEGYKLIGKDRPYFINLRDFVCLVFAQKKNSILDIAFMGNIEDVGQFDISSLFFRYPQLDYIDRYNAIEAIRNKTMKPIRGLDKENPYLLFNRMMNICAKYNMALFSNSVHRKSLKIIKERIRDWSPVDIFEEKVLQDFHGRMTKIAHYSTILKSLRRSEDPNFFINELVSTEVLSLTLPEMQLILESLSAQEKRDMKGLKDKAEVVAFLLARADANTEKSLKEKFSLLSLRYWDIEDQKIRSEKLEEQ